MPTFRKLLVRSVLVATIAAMMVAACYFWVDRSVAEFVQARGINHSEVLRRITDFPMWLNALAPVAAVYSVVRLAFGRLCRFERTGLTASVSLMIAVFFEYYLKFLAGRYWPETWLKPPNPSLLGTGDYGFHPFHFGQEYGSFPSGHTLRTASFVTVFALAYPRTRWVCAAVVVVVMASLVGMNYHFVGDTIGGAAVGYVMGSYVAAFAERRRPSTTPSPLAGEGQATAAGVSPG